MKKIISFALVLTFVLAMFTCGFAEDPAKIPGVAHYTGTWEVINDGKGIKALEAGAILVLEKTATAGTLEVTYAYNEVIKKDKWPAVFFQGKGFENVTETGSDNSIYAKTSESVYCWLRSGSVTVTNMVDGQYKDPRPDGKPAHIFANYKDAVGDDFASATEFTFKAEFGNGTVKTYINDVAVGGTLVYEADGNQIVFRSNVIKDDAGNVTSALTINGVKFNGEEILFKEAPDTGDATVIAVATVSFAVLACGAVLTISKKRIAE